MTTLKVYVASPFFNPDQLDTVEKVENMLERYNFNAFSPRLHGGVFNKEAPMEEREKQAKEIFTGNEKAMSEADFAVINLDDKDTGTAWEFGYFYSKGIPSVSYSKHGYGANIMLSQSGMAHFSDLTGLRLFLKNLNNVKKSKVNLKNRDDYLPGEWQSFMREMVREAISLTEEDVGIRFKGLSDE